MGASLVLSEGTMIIFGSWPRTISPILKNSKGNALTVNLFGTRLQAQFLLIIAVAVAVMALIYLLFEKSYIGIMMQAAAQDKPAAELMGISTLMTTAVTYMLVVVLVSIGGYMVAPVYTVTTSLASLQLRAFAGTVIGGFGSIKGAIIGCLLVGIVESFATVRFSSYKDAIVFLILIIFLIFRPRGLIIDKVADKA
jgi:branched-chain amino acid transport system permease protein